MRDRITTLIGGIIGFFAIAAACGVAYQGRERPQALGAPAPSSTVVVDAGFGTCTCVVPFPPPVVCSSPGDGGTPDASDERTSPNDSGQELSDGATTPDAIADRTSPSDSGQGLNADAPADRTSPSDSGLAGLHVQGAKILRADGTEFRIRGVNDIGFWRGGVPRAPLIASMVAMGANAVRIPLSGTFAGDGPGSASTPAYRAALTAQYVAAGLLPIPVEFVSRANQEVTNSEDPATLASVVDDWTGPDLAWARTLQVLNIANEWGPAASAVWRDSYNTAIARMRTAGITAVLIVDAGGSGEDAPDLITYAKAITDQNVCFSIHEYGAFWHDPANESWQFDLATTSDALKAIGRCVIVGEFSSKEYNTSQGGWFALDPARVIAVAEAHSFGWLGWELYNDSAENMLTGPNNAPMGYPPATSLTPFGQAIVAGLAGK